MKSEDIILLAGLGLGAYILTKPLQTATQGLGEGIATAGTGAGQGISDALTGTGSAIGEVAGGLASPFHYADAYLQEKINNIQMEAEFQRAFEQQANIYALERAQEAGKVKGDTLVKTEQIDFEKEEKKLVKAESATDLEKLKQEEKFVKEQIEASAEVERKGLWQNFFTNVSEGTIDFLSKAGSMYKSKALKDIEYKTNQPSLIQRFSNIITNTANTVSQTTSQFIGKIKEEAKELKSSTNQKSVKPAVAPKSVKQAQSAYTGGVTRYLTAKTPKSIASLPNRSTTFKASTSFVELARSRGIAI